MRLGNLSAPAQPLHSPAHAPLRLASRPLPFTAQLIMARRGAVATCQNSTRLAGSLEEPSLDYGPRICANGTFDFSCGATIYYGSLADPFPEFGGEQVTVSRSHDDGSTWANPVEATSTDNKSNFDNHDWVAVDHFPGSPHFGRVYVFWAVFCNKCAGNGNVKLYIAHSDDEGSTSLTAVQVSTVNNKRRASASANRPDGCLLQRHR